MTKGCLIESGGRVKEEEGVRVGGARGEGEEADAAESRPSRWRPEK